MHFLDEFSQLLKNGAWKITLRKSMQRLPPNPFEKDTGAAGWISDPANTPNFRQAAEKSIIPPGNEPASGGPDKKAFERIRLESHGRSSIAEIKPKHVRLCPFALENQRG